MERLTAVLDQAAGRHRRIGVVASIVAVAAVTGAIQLLKLAVPVLSLGVRWRNVCRAPAKSAVFAGATTVGYRRQATAAA